MDHVASAITPAAKLMLAYADMLLEGITPETFARKPEGIDTNSPAFCYGHLAIYPEAMLGMMGRSDLAIDASEFDALFSFGKDCLDDPDGTHYPQMDVILARFRERHGVVVEALAGVSDEVMQTENPWEGIRDRLPTVGNALTFLLGGHAMSHLGQVSAWRRVMGLTSVM